MTALRRDSHAAGRLVRADAFSYLISALAVLCIRGRHTNSEDPQRERFGLVVVGSDAALGCR